MASQNEERKNRKSLTRRSSNVASLVLNGDNLNEEGTALFIAATLLQREAVETLVPIQAAAILSLLYQMGVKSNSLVSGWDDEDWSQSMTYIGVDLLVELAVFVGSIVTLKRLYPDFDAGRILRGLLRMHWVEMVMFSFVIWLTNPAFPEHVQWRRHVVPILLVAMQGRIELDMAGWFRMGVLVCKINFFS